MTSFDDSDENLDDLLPRTNLLHTKTVSCRASRPRLFPNPTISSVSANTTDVPVNPTLREAYARTRSTLDNTTNSQTALDRTDTSRQSSSHHRCRDDGADDASTTTRVFSSARFPPPLESSPTERCTWRKTSANTGR